MIPLVIVEGPTASGKTALSVELAKRLGGEIISADSMQIYKYLNIGTAKPSEEEKCGVPHHLMDFVDPREDFSVADYAVLAHKAIKDIHARGKLPVMVGGTGLYIDTVADNVLLSPSGSDEALRRELEEYAKLHGNGALRELLREVDAESYEKLHENDTKRIIRALEVFRLTGKTIAEHNRESRSAPQIYKPIRLMFEYDREILYGRINKRVDIMLETGLEAEVRECLAMGLTEKNTSMQAIGYKEMTEYIRGFCSFEDAVENIKRESRRYAKRQISWFKRRKYHGLTPCEVAADNAEAIVRGEL